MFVWFVLRGGRSILMLSVFTFLLVGIVFDALGIFVPFVGLKASLGRFITLDYFIILLLIHYLLLVIFIS